MNPVVAQLLAVTLLHFLWQGAIVGLAFATVRAVASDPRRRYAAGVLATVACLVWPLVTLVSALLELPGAPAAGPDAAPVGAAAAGSTVLPATAISLGWCAGATLVALRTAAGLVWLRLRVLHDRLAPPAALREIVDRLAAEVGVHPVRLWSSERVGVPQVVGFLRPLVLVPLSLPTRLSPAQLEAVLLHELLHLRRRDPWVQALQTVAETLLFFHPVVWWLSAELRREREFCCDAAVVERTGRRLDYAQALVALAESVRPPHSPRRTALAATGGPLMERIRRIVDPHARTARVRSLPSAAVGGLLLVALAVTTLFAASGPGRDDSGPILWMPESVRQWEGVLAEAGREHGVDPALLSILALVESNGNPEAVSRTGALGLLQIMPATGAAIAERRGIEGFDPERLMDPSINADFGAYLLGEYLERFRDDRDPAATVEWAAAAYNGGLKRAEAHRRGVAELSDETLKYKGLVRKLWLQRDAVEPPEFVERRLAKMESTAR